MHGRGLSSATLLSGLGFVLRSVVLVLVAVVVAICGFFGNLPVFSWYKRRLRFWLLFVFFLGFSAVWARRWAHPRGGERAHQREARAEVFADFATLSPKP